MEQYLTVGKLKNKLKDFIDMYGGEGCVLYDYYDEIVRMAWIDNEGEWCEQEPDDILVLDEDAAAYKYYITVQELYNDLQKYPDDYKLVFVEYGHKFGFYECVRVSLDKMSIYLR